MSESAREHRAAAAASLNLAVLTISDTRTIETDTSGALIVRLAEASGHQILDRRIVPDEPEPIRATLIGWRQRPELHAALVTGGTGISPRDQTFETVSALLTHRMPGYGELFRMLSYQEIGPAAMLSRALGGLSEGLAIFVMPGSRAAVELALERLLLPELPHIVREARKV